MAFSVYWLRDLEKILNFWSWYIKLFNIIFFTTNEIPRCLYSHRSFRQKRHQYQTLYVDAKDIKALLGSVESHATDDDINRVINSLKGKNIHQLISEGHNRLGSSASTPAVQAAKPAKETKKE